MASMFPEWAVPDSYDVQVTVFGQNEAPRLAQNLRSISAALGRRTGLITLILNGSTDDSAAVARAIAPALAHPLTVCTVPFGDKSNAINLSWYELRRPARLYVSVDAYATINPGAIDAFEARLAECPQAHAASALAAAGRSSVRENQEAMDPGGRLRGQCHALRPAFLDRIAARGIRQPIGTYWGDGLLGSMACTDLRANGPAWDNRRVVGTPGALFTIPVLSPYRPADIARHYRRMIRQERGRLQNAAITRWLETRPYEDMPEHADDLVLDDLSRNELPPVGRLRRHFRDLALKQVRGSARPAPDQLAPSCILA